MSELQSGLNQRRIAYKQAFQGVAGETVLADLARFCRAKTSTFHENERVHALMEGRREVWLRISQHLNLTEDELFQLYK